VPIQGNIEEAGLPDVLQLLSLGRKSGCLTLVDGETQGHIYLDVGRISYATVANRLDRLGDMLVKGGRITQQQLASAVDEQGRTGKRQLGRILVDSGQIERGELERFIRLQVENAVYYLFTWKQGTFSFASDRLPPHQPLLVSLDAESLLLEGARRVDEWSLIEKKIPSFDLVYRSTREKLGSSADGLTDEQKLILPMLDGSRDVAAIIDLTALGEFEVGKALYGLLTAGFVQLVERRAHIRHLDYRDLLAYVVREAEFTDPQRRKEAARHIVDCQTCAERLRTIHVRRSTGTGMMVPVESPEAGVGAVSPLPQASFAAPARQTPPAPPPQVPFAPPARQAQPVLQMSTVPPTRHPHGPRPAAPEPPPPLHVAADTPDFVERRATERRTGRDRRAFDRRTGYDRRTEVGLSNLQPNVERRRGPRRDDDRRGGGAARNRRGSDAGHRAAVVATPEPGLRTTEPRQLHTVEQRGEDEIDAMVAGDLSAVETTSVAAQLLGFTLEPEPAPEAQAPAPPAPPPIAAAPPKGAAVAPEVTAAESDEPDLEWLVTPRESLEMIRASQAQLRSMAAATNAQARTGATARAPVPDRRAAAAGSVAAAGAAPRTESRRLERFRGGANGARATDAAKGANPGSARLTFPLRSLAVAAGLACVALLGYMAGQIGRQGRAERTGESTQANTLAPTAAQAQSRTGARGSESRVRSRAAQAPPALAAAPAVTGTVPNQPARDARAGAPPRSRAITPVPVAAAAPAPAAPPAPTVGVIRGVVRDAGGSGVAGARVSVRGTALSAVADGSGAFEIREVPDGQVSLQASADGFVASSGQVRATAGAIIATDLTLERVPAPPPAAAPAATASEPDRELAAGGWIPVDRAAATSMLGGTLGAIQGLTIESIASSAAGSRPRVRLAQVTASGERIVLTETRAGAAVRGGSGPAVVTALRVMPASEAYPWCTGTASLGNILVTVKTKLSADALRPLLQRLGEAPGQ
jgi:hypothetical protein